jgi:hypothetical protein
VLPESEQALDACYSARGSATDGLIELRILQNAGKMQRRS